MSCQEFWKRLSKPPGEESNLDADHRAHLAECPACSAHMARQQELAAGLKLVAEHLSELRAPARVEGRLLRAFRAQNGLTEPLGRSRWMVAACWAAAAVLLFAIAMLLSGGRQPAPLRAGTAAVELAAEQEIAAAEADGFIPLPNAERLGPNDDVNMVRMEVPRSTVEELGFTISADRDTDRVEADVLLGSDGVARAVRFLD
jgi:anti-sigma factor RsiW